MARLAGEVPAARLRAPGGGPPEDRWLEKVVLVFREIRLLSDTLDGRGE